MMADMFFKTAFLTAVMASLASVSCAKEIDKQKEKAAAAALAKAKKEAQRTAALVAARTTSGYGEWIEPDFPFFSSVLDARGLGGDWPANNLTPRGIVLSLGENTWACFDTDLLRLALVWKGEDGEPPVTQNALASGSYHLAGQKTKDGQEDLVKPVGTPWLANGIYPGWISGSRPVDLKDPREASASPEEIGRGPLSGDSARFLGLDLSQPGPVLRYEVAGVVIREWISANKEVAQVQVVRTFLVPPHEQPLTLVVGQLSRSHAWQASLDGDGKFQMDQTTPYSSVTLAPAETPTQLRLTLGADLPPAEDAPSRTVVATEFAKVSMPRWNDRVTTQGNVDTEAKKAYVIEDIPLPNPNPWKRNVRLADVAFLDNQGTAAAVTMDGDVWLISGLKDDLKSVQWQRYASGLHEPMSIVSRNGDLFVFDRNGIWKLNDTDGDRVADAYEMFCNRFGQTAETREFPNSMKLGPDGSFFIAKGGQEGTTHGKHNGTVIRVSPDGTSFAVIGHGLRQPFIGVHPKTGLVTASDQQGNYVPSTPLHIIRDNQFYGHLPTISPKEKYPGPIADPLTWIPHPVNASAVSQTWLVGAKMGTLNDELIHIGYNRPELFRVLVSPREGKPQAAVVPFTQALDFSPINATVNPADGQLYVVGFQIWGTTAKRISGMARVRYTGGARVLLTGYAAMDKGVLLRFNEPLDEAAATDPASYSAERWNYRRTFDYGSPHLKLDGTTGQEWLIPSSAYLSKDKKSVFIGIPDMKPAMQMRLGWSLKGQAGEEAQNNAYFTPYALAEFLPEKEGFEPFSVDLTPRKDARAAAAKPTLEEGFKISQMFGCMACHSIDGSVVGKVGPSWKGLYDSTRILKDGKEQKADDAYLRESILSPSAKVLKGFEKFDAGMPIYAGILTEAQIESLILYIKTLK
jgi:glucose/arabinose dehydrogenase/mono/diheme cytochrome c family protein